MSVRPCFWSRAITAAWASWSSRNSSSGKLTASIISFLLALVVSVDRFLEVVADADIVNHEALVLGFATHAVHTGDGLQQIVGNHDLVQIHHLLDRGIEACKQHVVDDEDPQVAVDTVFVTSKRQFEALDARLVP